MKQSFNARAEKAPELKSFNIEDEYTIQDGKIKIAPLVATYYDKQKKQEFEKQLTNYHFYVDGAEVEIDQKGMIQKDMKEGAYAFKIEWDNNGTLE